MKRLTHKLPAPRVIAVAVGAVAIGATALTLLARQPEETKRLPNPSITVSVVTPEAAEFARAIASTGTVRARDELIVGSDAAGVRIVEVLADVGDTVKRGQLLVRADDSQLRAQLAQQDAMIRQAQVELMQANSNFERAERVRDSGVFSVEVQETRRTSALAAQAKLDLAIAQKRELEVRIAQTRVHAPADGVIAKKSATVGAVMQSGAELFRLIKDGELEWLGELPAHSLAKVRPGVGARVTLDDGSAIDAKVRQVAPTIDAATRNGLVHVSLPAATPFKAGSHAKGEILIGRAAALAVPEASVLTRDGYTFVYVVGGDGAAKLTRIQTGARSRGLVEVLSGITPEARVVRTGAGFVKDGDLVRVESETTQRVANAGGQS